MNIRKRLTPKEREDVQKLLEGRLSPERGRGKEILERPHVAITLEDILNQAGLTDKKLAKRLDRIVNRRPIVRKNEEGRVVKSNAPTLDANALQAIRVIWQARGKFTEKHDVTHHGEMEHLQDQDLDSIIERGEDLIQRRKGV